MWLGRLKLVKNYILQLRVSLRERRPVRCGSGIIDPLGLNVA